jgi:anaerobic selenocysteine-containing dehydrogenase
LFGNSIIGFDPRTAKDATCILVWGANPSHSAPHAHEHWLQEAPGKVVVVDPIRTESAQAADLHLQLQPGSDAALAFGLLHVLHSMGKFNQSFIDNSTFSAEEIMPTVAMCTPAWTAVQTGLPVEKTIEATEIYGAGPALPWCGQGLQPQPTGDNIMRAVGLLPTLTGNVGKPGAGFCYLNYTPRVRRYRSRRPGRCGVEYEAWRNRQPYGPRATLGRHQ